MGVNLQKLPTLRAHFQSTSASNQSGLRLYPNPSCAARFKTEILTKRGFPVDVEMRLQSARALRNVRVDAYKDGQNIGIISTSINSDYFLADPNDTSIKQEPMPAGVEQP